MSIKRNPLLMTLIIALLVMIVTTVVTHNTIIERHNSAIRAWSDLIAQERQKNSTLPELEKIVETYSAHERALLTEVTALRGAINRLSPDNIDTTQLAEVQNRSNALIRNFNAVAENYPDLKASTLYRDQMAELITLQRDIAAAIRIFNRNVEEFNSGIEVIPNRWVNQLITHKERIHPFSDREAEAAFDYQPNF